jgi:hypothetical protein
MAAVAAARAVTAMRDGGAGVGSDDSRRRLCQQRRRQGRRTQ